jgi:hypothetical protein
MQKNNAAISLTSLKGGSIFAKARIFPYRDYSPAIHTHHGIMDNDLPLDPDHLNNARMESPPAVR